MLAGTAVAGAGAAVAGCGPALAQPRERPTLAALGARTGLLVGTAFGPQIETDAVWRRIVAGESSILAVESALKFDWLRSAGPTADFALADRMVAFAEARRLPARAAGFLWNDYPPRWLRGLPAAQLRTTFDRHLDEVVPRYAGRIHSWEVNEPFWPGFGNPGGFRSGPWYTAYGPGHIARGLKRIGVLDPTAKLVVNEAFTEQDDELGKAVRPLLSGLVDRLQGEGVRLAAVGLQGHLKPHIRVDYKRYAEWVASIAAKGVKIYLTEVDVDDRSFPDDPALRDAMVAAELSAYLTAVLAVPQVEVLIFWPKTDRYSYYRELAETGALPTRRVPRTSLLDDQHQPKAAWQAVAEALAARKPV
jgi:endo-1,4-beta-xylanase